MNLNEQLIAFLDSSHTCFQAIDHVRQILNDNGYTELNEAKLWNLEQGGKYFVVRNESSLIAFHLPQNDFNSFMIGASHSDSPNFKIKENPEIVSNGYVKLNVEGYGGMLMGPWLDRSLSVAGRVVVRDGNMLRTVKVDVDDDWMLIPNMAIHMNRNANSNQTWNVQTDLLPVIGSEKEAKGLFFAKVAEAVGVKPEDIIGHDLYLYIREEGKIWGLQKEYISAPRLDDLQCSFADLMGFVQAEPKNSAAVLAIFDNEEVGSRTKQGADSTFLQDTLERICVDTGKTMSQYRSMVASSFMVSADNAHAIHPNHPEKADPVNRPQMNQGIVIKYNANQSYTTDAVSAAMFKAVCDMVNVPVQSFTNRSDERGGSTLGNISNAHVSLNTVDIGLAQLAMHSPYETCGTKDTEYLMKAMQKFFSSSIVQEEPGTYKIDA